MTQRLPPGFLTRGYGEPAASSASRHGRMRAATGLPAREVLPPFILSLSKDEGTAAREWLRHVEAGRIGGS